MDKSTVSRSPEGSKSMPGASCILQRKCDCGSHAAAAEQCEECAKGTDDLQRKLSVGKSDDPFEREADRIADQVIAMPIRPDVAGATLHIQRYSGSATENKTPVPASVNQAIASTGTALDPSLRQSMEQRFGRDFSNVRVHADGLARRSARDINAHAYTVGSDIVFGSGRFSPGTNSGRRLIAHELTHVVQQSAPGPAHGNHQAARTSHVPQTLQPISAKPASPTVQRQDAAPAAPAATDGGLSDEMLNQIARVLHDAMQGAGTDEEAIYSAFAGRSQAQVDAIARVYEATYGTPLIDDLRGDLSESELKHLGIFSPTAAPGEAGSEQQTKAFAELVAHQLHKAMKGLGTDEEAVYAALTGRTEAQLREIKDAYKRLTNRELEADIRDDFSGAELTRAMALLNQGVLFAEDEAYLAMKGAGTDEETLLRVLESVKDDRAKVIDLIDKFAAKNYGNLLDRINEELSGSDLDKAIEALHGETPSGTCSKEERKAGLMGISAAISLAQNAVSKLNAVIGAGALSDSIRTVLRRNFNPGGAAGAVTVGLAGRVRDVLRDTRSDMLGSSDVSCTSTGLCVANPDCARFTYGWTFVAVPGATVQLCPAYFSCLEDKPRGMLHEFVHHIGMHDRAYRSDPAYQSLTPIGDGSAHDSLDNADSYATFAREASY